MPINKKLRDTTNPAEDNDLNPFLIALGQRVRERREWGNITRKSLAAATGVSERHLANLEYGTGNVSVLVLQQVALALNCAPAELIGDVTTTSPEWLRIRTMLADSDDETLHQARMAITRMLGTTTNSSTRVALIGLRGAGKSTLGKMLAQELNFPLIEISREIERLAGCTIAEIQDLYGASAYRRYERQSLEESIQLNTNAILAIPGGLVADPVNFNLLLSHCTTIWLQADPTDHMRRVIEQGDFRPMAESKEAMEDLKSILSAREEYYSRADFRLDTSEQSLESTFGILQCLVKDNLLEKD